MYTGRSPAPTIGKQPTAAGENVKSEKSRNPPGKQKYFKIPNLLILFPYWGVCGSEQTVSTHATQSLAALTGGVSESGSPQCPHSSWELEELSRAYEAWRPSVLAAELGALFVAL